MKDREDLRILLVTPQLPYPPMHGAAVRMWNLLKALGTTHRVDLLSFIDPGWGQEEIEVSQVALQPYCHRLRLMEMPATRRRDLLDRTIHVEMFDSPLMRAALEDMVAEQQYDVVQFDKTEMGQYLMPGVSAVQVLVEHIVFYRAYGRQFLSWRPSVRHLVDYLKLRRYELGLCRRFDGVITMSAVDSEYLRQRLRPHACIADLPNGVDTEYYGYNPRPPASHDLLFIGNFHHSPNVQGLSFFMRQVFPQIKVAVPDVRLLIVGPGPYQSLPEVAAEPAVALAGAVEDTRSYLAKSALCVAPILAGSGTRLKILEAMAAGLPVVSTTIGAEGLEVDSGRELLIADSPRAFADAVIRLLRHRILGEQLRVNARALVERQYRWDDIAVRAAELFRGLVHDKRSIEES